MSLCSEARMVALPAEVVRYFQVDRRDLVFLKFILEAYEGMATMTTVQREGVIVRISSPHGFAADVHDLLASLAAEIRMQETDFTVESELHA